MSGNQPIYFRHDKSARQLTSDEWIRILRDDEVTKEKYRKMLNIIFHANNYTMNGVELKKQMEEGGQSLLIYSWVTAIAKKYEVELALWPPSSSFAGKTMYWALFFLSTEDPIGSHYFWRLKPELIEALNQIKNWKHIEKIGDDIDEETSTGWHEGRKTHGSVSRYERNPRNREKAIQAHKKRYGQLNCCACEFNFEKTYGELGKEFIEVHHLTPLSSNEHEVRINPKTDLVCLCSNCHSMIHRKKVSFLTLADLRNILKQQQI